VDLAHVCDTQIRFPRPGWKYGSRLGPENQHAANRRWHVVSVRAHIVL